jgi:signal transduction histidine kinase/ActR/RegA family two-component response regulator
MAPAPPSSPPSAPHSPAPPASAPLPREAWHRWVDHTRAAFRRSWRGLLTFALAYAVLSGLSLRVVSSNSAMTPLWPPAGVMAAGLLLLDTTPLWMVFLAAFIGQRLSVNPVAIPSVASLILVGAACVEGWLARLVIHHVSGGPTRFARVRDILGLLLGTLVAVTLSGTAAGMVRADSFEAFRQGFLNWAIGGGLGILMVTPFAVAWIRPRDATDPSRDFSGLEAGMAVALTLLVTYAAFRDLSLSAVLNVPPYALIGPLLWGALRFGVRGVSLGVLLVAVVAAPLQLLPDGNVLGGDTPEIRLLRLQLFLAFMTVTGLLLAAALTEQRAAAAAETRAVEAMLASERRLQQAQKMEAVGQLAGGVAHDFNNILAAMSLQAQELRLASGLAPAEARTVGEMQDAIRRAAALTRQLLLFSRRQVREDRPVDLGLLVASLGEMLTRLLPESVRLAVIPPTRPVRVQGDPSMLEQVLLNLVVNARDALPRGGTITVTLREQALDADAVRAVAPGALTVEPGVYALLRVEDTGTGIAPEHQGQLFEPFFTTKEPGRGTGLGLSTVFGVARQHHGFVRLVTSGPTGTVFEFGMPALAGDAAADTPVTGHPAGRVDEVAPTGTVLAVPTAPPLPPAAAAATPVVQPETPHNQDGGEPGALPTVLLVEDDPGVRRMVERILQRGAWRVISAENAQELFGRWDTVPAVDVLLTDLVLTGSMGGVELAAEVSARLPGVRVIYTSGYDPAYGDHDVQMTPGVNFLAKPFSADLLLEVVRRQVEAAPGSGAP